MEANILSAVEDQIRLIHAINPDSVRSDSWKKVQSDEIVLGVLSPTMRKMWAHRQLILDQFDALAMRISDLQSAHFVEHENGKKPTKENCREHDLRVKIVMDLIMAPKDQLNFISSVFRAGLYFDFSPLPEKPVLGVREGFKVICRADNTRNDDRGPAFAVYLKPH